MSSTSNLQALNLSKISAENYFNNFFTRDFSVSASTNDAVVGFFEKLTGDPASAKIISSSVLYTALNQGFDPMKIMDEFYKLTPGELNAYLCIFLNLSRRSTSQLGLLNAPRSNQYIQRTILV
jgi:hypothetical protein